MSMTEEHREKVEKVALATRVLSIEAVEKANSGHPGMPLGAADMASVLWSGPMRFNPSDPGWLARDRFVLSAGHGSMLLYSLLHLFGYDLPLGELQSFRQWGSKTPGHPEFGLTTGVETTTGPLGQGFANGVGLALSSQLLAERYDTELLLSRVFGIVSDGDLMEGISSEAASLAGHWKLGNLVYLYDDNQISIGGSTDICFTESVAGRFEAYGWHVQTINGHDLNEINLALDEALSQTDRPSLICAKTTIGFGSPGMAGSADSHGAPLGKEELKKTKEALGWKGNRDFCIPEETKDICRQLVQLKLERYQDWNEQFAKWKASHSGQAEALDRQLKRVVPEELETELLELFAAGEKEATRASNGKCIQVLAKHLPYFIGGSADLEPSNKTLVKDANDVGPGDFSGRNLRFGVREHAMGAIANGMAYTQHWIPYTGTFLVFADYMRPSIRLAALSHLQSLFIFTHDSFWVGEDGPTHQPVEHIASLRIIPNLYVFRPADGLESAMCYSAAVQKLNAPSALLFTRQSVPALKRSEAFQPRDVLSGGYVVSGEKVIDLVLVATGSEVWACQEAAKLLEEKGVHVRLVSMPCMELFLEQDQAYRDRVIPSGARVISVEAGVSDNWHRFTGLDGLCICMERFGASAPGEELAEKFGFTPESIANKIQGWLNE